MSVTIRVPNGLDPDQYRRYVCPDLGSYCLKTLIVTLSMMTCPTRIYS